MNRKYYAAISLACLLLAGCDNPGGISDADYAKYKELAAPKILYSCFTQQKKKYKELLQEYDELQKKLPSDQKLPPLDLGPEHNLIPEVGLVSGVGINATYNRILAQSREECDGDYEILESEKK